MSEPKLISPLLDNFIMGDPISDHNGIRCCPAMEQSTNGKYIVKIISLPASATQLEAMLLTGALKDEDDALVYYQERAKDVVREIEVLQELSHQEGFISCSGCQIVPMEDRIGFDVYILTPYRRTLERQFIKKPLTHLDALNLGLDICSALTSSRRSGYLFTNLKPSNIFITENGEYKICDSGFVALNGLAFASIPEHHIGAYTPPEITDAFSSLNTSMDVYSIGMLLYMIFNGGVLPENKEDLVAPQYADSELCEIILKACSISVEERWQDPAQMGQALITYMQKNGASDKPIVPPVVLPTEPITEDQNLSENTTEENPSANLEQITEITEETMPDITEESADSDESSDSTSEGIPADILSDETLVTEESTLSTDADDAEEIFIPTEEISSAISEETENTSEEDVPPPAEDTAEVDEIIEGDALSEEISYDEISDEVSQMLSQVDELASVEVPDPVVAPEPVEITIPVSQEETSAESSQDTMTEINGIKALLHETDEQDEENTPDASPVYVDDDEEDYDEDFYNEVPRRSHWLRNTLLILLAIGILIAGFLFYKFYIIQTIDDLEFVGSKDHLTVILQTETDDAKLSVSCSDIYGHEITVPVVDGQASFSGLIADSEYSLTVNINGLHILQGVTNKNYFTDSKTSIVQCDVVTGKVSGEAILSFVIEGPDSQNWIFTYLTSDGDTKSVTFSGHSVTLTDLVEGQEYRGILAPEDDIFLDQEYELTFSPAGLIQATDLRITSCLDGTLKATWNAPADMTVSGWTVRCYNDAGYDKTITVQDCSAEFTGLNSSDSFTVEVTAFGQSISQQTTIGANSITVQNMLADVQTEGIITLTWDSASIPSSGWIVSYTISNSNLSGELPTDSNSVTLSPAVPSTEYTFSIRAADDTSVAFEPHICLTPDAKDFSVNYHGNHVTRSNLHFSMCIRPNKSNWNKDDVKTFTTRFKSGQNAALLVFLDRKYDISADPITTAFVICDENGQIISVDSSTRAWSNMWYKNYCELNIPSIPQESGNYTLYVYFNGQLAEKQSFSVV